MRSRRHTTSDETKGATTTLEPPSEDLTAVCHPAQSTRGMTASRHRHPPREVYAREMGSQERTDETRWREEEGGRKEHDDSDVGFMLRRLGDRRTWSATRVWLAQGSYERRSLCLKEMIRK